MPESTVSLVFKNDDLAMEMYYGFGEAKRAEQFFRVARQACETATWQMGDRPINIDPVALVAHRIDRLGRYGDAANTIELTGFFDLE